MTPTERAALIDKLQAHDTRQDLINKLEAQDAAPDPTSVDSATPNPSLLPDKDVQKAQVKAAADERVRDIDAKAIQNSPAAKTGAFLMGAGNSLGLSGVNRALLGTQEMDQAQTNLPNYTTAGKVAGFVGGIAGGSALSATPGLAAAAVPQAAEHLGALSGAKTGAAVGASLGAINGSIDPDAVKGPSDNPFVNRAINGAGQGIAGGLGGAVLGAAGGALASRLADNKDSTSAAQELAETLGLKKTDAVKAARLARAGASPATNEISALKEMVPYGIFKGNPTYEVLDQRFQDFRAPRIRVLLNETESASDAGKIVNFDATDATQKLVGQGYGVSEAEAAIQAALARRGSRLGPGMDPIEALTTKQNLGKQMSSSAYAPTRAEKISVEADKAIYGTLQVALDRTIDKPIFSAANRELAASYNVEGLVAGAYDSGKVGGSMLSRAATNANRGSGLVDKISKAGGALRNNLDVNLVHEPAPLAAAAATGVQKITDPIAVTNAAMAYWNQKNIPVIERAKAINELTTKGTPPGQAQAAPMPSAAPLLAAPTPTLPVTLPSDLQADPMKAFKR